MSRATAVARAAFAPAPFRALGSRSYAQLTYEHYNLKRMNYSTPDSRDIDFFKKTGAKVSTEKEELELVNEDWMHKYRGESRILLKPTSTQQVSEILRHCNERKLAVVPQGGNTGLVGGGVPVFDEIVISLANMNKIHSFDPLSGAFIADAGVILQDAEEYLRNHQFVFPLDLGAKGSCMIGGNISTNAGGLRLIRYGNLHGSILGLEAVLPSGEIFDGMSILRKDNTGYDLKQLFVGAEGTLGIVTKVAVHCPPASKSVNVAFLGLPSYDKVKETFMRARQDLGEILSAFECMDDRSLKLVRNRFTDLQQPFDQIYPFAVLIETMGSNVDHDQEKLQHFLEDVMESGTVVDGVVAQDGQQIKNLWAWRELVPEAATENGGVYKYDVSLPLGSMWELVTAVQDRLVKAGVMGPSSDQPVIDTVGYGHLGDSNLHLNVALRRYDIEVEKLLEPYVFDFVQNLHGSVSAEHGVGFQKAHALHYSKSPGVLKMMWELRKHYDPNLIMNPYKYVGPQS